MLARTSVVDLVTKDDDTGAYELVLVVEADEWALPNCHALLQAKVNAYLEYVLDGQMKTDYSDARAERVEILIQSEGDPPSATAAFIGRLVDTVKSYGVTAKYVPL